jgi:pectinesterase
VALRSNSNKSVVYQCSMEGHEDTFYAENGIQFYL